MSTSGLVLVCPELDARVAEIRSRHDPAARYGMPAHVTVLYPFMDPAKLRPDLHARLAEVIGGFAGFELRFSRVSRFPEALWAAPEPSEAIVALVEAIAAAFPDYPPYEGQFESVIPHATVAMGESFDLAALEPELRRRLAEPVVETVDAVSLFTTVKRRWREVDRFLLA